jgi:hypothetical protein
MAAGDSAPAMRIELIDEGGRVAEAPVAKYPCPAVRVYWLLSAEPEAALSL